MVILQGLLSQSLGHYILKWLKKYKPHKERLLTRHSVAKIIRMIKPESLNALLIAWVKAYLSQTEANSIGKEIKKIRSVFAIDGKEIRGVKTRTGKGQETQRVHNALKIPNLKECLVTFNALYSPIETVEEIVKNKSIVSHISH